MAGIDEVVDRILARRAEVPENRSLLVGISGIDGCGNLLIRPNHLACPP